MSTPYQNITTEVKKRAQAEHLVASAFGQITLEDLTPEAYRAIGKQLRDAADLLDIAASAKALVSAAPRRLLVIGVRG